ncbi:MAG TPA: hypothetical protein VIX82_01090 [Solirubrobacteraceae bacterium]
MSAGVARYGIGVFSLLVICAALALAAMTLRRRFFAERSGALARLIETLIGLTLLIWILEALGTIGLFRLVPIVCGCVAVGVAVALSSRGVAPRGPGANGRASVRVGATLAILAGATVAAEWASPTLQAYVLGVHTFDSLWYHLPWAAGFAQTGHVTQLHYDLEFLLAFYPATGELLHGLGIVLFGHDTISPGLNLVWLGLSLLAAWCVGQSKGMGAISVWGVAVILAAPMMYFSQAGSGDDDVVGAFFLLSSAALLLNAEDDRWAYVLAAISAGLAISVKLTFLAPVGVLTLGVLALAPRGRRARRAGDWIAPLILGGGFWYVRNLIAVGNPLPWSSFGVLPTPAPPLQQPTTFSIAHYLTSSGFWDHYFVQGMSSQLGSWWYVLLAGAILGPILCLLPGSGRMLRVLAVVALAGLVAYVLTPNGAMGPEGNPVGFAFNLRFALPAFTLAFAITPLAPGLNRSSAARSTLLVGLAAAFVATVAKPVLWPHQHYRAAIAFGVAILALGLAMVWVPVAMGRRQSAGGTGANRSLRIAAIAAFATLLGASAAAGYPWQQRYLRGRFGPRPKTSELTRVWEFFRHMHHARIGLVGTYGEFLSYPIFGNDDSNRVQYIAHHGANGSFTPIAGCPEFRRAVDAGHVRYLVTTPSRNFWVPHQLFFSPEGNWTVSDPAAHARLSYLALGRRVSVFELTGLLDPAACP